jgi:hypothetical protein
MPLKISNIIVAALALTLITCVEVRLIPAQELKVSPQLWQNVKEKGTVKVIVQLNRPWKIEADLSKEQVLLQREAIANSQKALLKELETTPHRIMAEFKGIPAMGLEVGQAALAVLEKSMLVAKVFEDVPASAR